MATIILVIFMVAIGMVVGVGFRICDYVTARRIKREASVSLQYDVLLDCGDYIQLPLSARPMEGMIYPCNKCRVRSSLDFTPWVEATKHIEQRPMLDCDMTSVDDLL